MFFRGCSGGPTPKPTILTKNKLLKKESCAPSVKSGNAQPPKTRKILFHLKNIFFISDCRTFIDFKRSLERKKVGSLMFSKNQKMSEEDEILRKMLNKSSLK